MSDPKIEMKLTITGMTVQEEEDFRRVFTAIMDIVARGVIDRMKDGTPM